MEVFWKLGYILHEIDKFKGHSPFGQSGLYVPEGYLPRDVELSVSTPCAVLNKFYEDVEADFDPDFRPPFAIENNLYEISDLQMAAMIVHAARHQKPDCTLEELTKSFMYYLYHDAFLELVESNEPIFLSLEPTLLNLDRYQEKEGGQYYMFAPRGFEGKHLSVTFCVIWFIEDQEFEKDPNYLPDFAISSKMYRVANLQVLKTLVAQALTHKPDPLDVVGVLNQYILKGSLDT